MSSTSATQPFAEELRDATSLALHAPAHDTSSSCLHGPRATADSHTSCSSAVFMDADYSPSDIAPQICPFNFMQPDATLSGNFEQHGHSSSGISTPAFSAENSGTTTAQHASHAHGLFVGEPVARPFGHEGATKMRTCDVVPKPFETLVRSPSCCADSLHSADASMRECSDSH